MHEHQLVHCDFGTHNIGKFGSRWKLLGVGGSVPTGKASNPNRGFYHPPESIVVENKRAAIGKKSITAVVVSIPARSTYDIWAYGDVFYEAVAGVPLSPYACRGKRPMTSAEVAKIGQWDESSIKKALKHLPPDVDSNAKSLIKKLLHYDPSKRFNSMRQVLEHPFFASAKSSQASSMNTGKSTTESSYSSNNTPQAMSSRSGSLASGSEWSISSRHTKSRAQRYSGSNFSGNLTGVDENAENYVNSVTEKVEMNSTTSMPTVSSKRNKKFGTFRNRFKSKHSAN